MIRRSMPATPCFLGLVAAGLLSLAVPAAADGWSGTTADRVISFDDNEYARAVQLVCDESFLHALWTEDAPSVRELHYGRSGVDTDAWTCETEDRVISFPDGNAASEECSVVIGTSGEIVAVWAEDDAGVAEIHYGISTDQGQSWSCTSEDRILSDSASLVDAFAPSVTADAAGVLHAVWHQSAGGTAEVHYSRSSDHGASWSGASGDRVISFPDGHATLEPRIAACENALVVIWREAGDDGAPRIHAGISTDGGATWSSETADHEISPSASLMTDAVISAYRHDGDQGIHVAYRASYDTASPYYYEIYATSSYDLGQSWSGESVLTPVSHDEGAGRSASNPAIHVGYFRPPMVVWDEEDDAAGTKEQHFSWCSGTEWSGAAADSVISFPDGENGYRPSITATEWVSAADPLRDMPFAIVAWTEFNGSSTDNYEVHISYCYASGGGGVDERPASRSVGLCVLPNPGRGRTEFRLSLARPGPARVMLFDMEGRLIRALGGASLPAGDATIVWDGRDAAGRLVAPGRYCARLAAVEGVNATRLTRF